MRRKHPHTADLVATVRRWYANGNSQYAIADALGVCQKWVWKFMRAHGIPARPAYGFIGRCSDCGKPCGRDKRCPVHKRLAMAKSARDWARKHRKIKPERWHLEKLT